MKKIIDNKEKGKALIEYLLIITLVSTVSMSVIRLIGGYIKDNTTKNSCNLVNKIYVLGDKPGSATCEER